MNLEALIYYLIHICQIEEHKDIEEKVIDNLEHPLELMLVGFVKVLGHDNFLDLLEEYEDDIESSQLLEWYSNYLSRDIEEF